MPAQSPLGNVVILKLPIQDDESKREFYQLFRIYDNILFFGFEMNVPFIQVIILQKDQSLINEVNAYIEGATEINYSDLFRSGDPSIRGNKLLLPFRNLP